MQARVKVGATIPLRHRRSAFNNVQRDQLFLAMTSQIALTVPAKKRVHVLHQLFITLRMTLGGDAVLQATTLRRNSTRPLSKCTFVANRSNSRFCPGVFESLLALPGAHVSQLGQPVLSARRWHAKLREGFDHEPQL
jgi:hypothetical protein